LGLFYEPETNSRQFGRWGNRGTKVRNTEIIACEGFALSPKSKIGKVAAAILLSAMVQSFMADQSRAAEITQPTGVVELFTSQGCSSCPPADRVLQTLSKDPETLALSWHVDYWDYLGWKDTLANPVATKRQQGYAHSLAKRSVYTPQAIINGHTDIVGSHGSSVEEALARFAGTPKGITVPIDATISAGMLKIRVDAIPASSDATLWMVYFDNNREVQVERGENAGKNIVYTNIVHDIEMIGKVHDQVLQTEFALKEMGHRGYDSCALILQKTTTDGTPGPIIGAAYIKDVRS
jgi:hypothetical protein